MTTRPDPSDPPNAGIVTRAVGPVVPRREEASPRFDRRRENSTEKLLISFKTRESRASVELRSSLVTRHQWRVVLRAVAATVLGGLAFFLTIPAFCSGSCTAIVGISTPADSSTLLIYAVGLAFGVLVAILVWWLLGLTMVKRAERQSDSA